MINLEPVQPVSEANTHPEYCDFVVMDDIAKSNDINLVDITRRIVAIVRKEHVDYEAFLDICQRVRKEAGLRKLKRAGKKLPQILSDADLSRFFHAIQDAENIEHEIMLKFLLFTALRVSELVGIKTSDVDLGSSKVFINQGKGNKDRYILFPSSFRLILASHMKAHPRNTYLFESAQSRAYSPRRIQQLVKLYQDKAGIKQRIHPHLLRHQMLTWLTKSGLSDAQIQLISGHSSKQSLEIYQHLGLEAVEKAYQDAAAAADLGLSGRAD